MSNRDASIVWTVLLVIMVMVAGDLVTKDRVVSGVDIDSGNGKILVVYKFETGKNILITGSEATSLSAESSKYFLLRNGERTIFGVPTPLRFESDKEHFTTSTQEKVTGFWKLPVGSAEFTVVGEKPMTVTLRVIDKSVIFVGLAIIALVVWAFGFWTIND